MTKEIACVLAGSLLKKKMWIWISSFRHVVVCSWFFSSASHKYRHERKSLRLFRQKALYSSWSLPLQPRWSECCGRHWRKFNKSSSCGRRHICGRCDLSKTLPNIKLYRWWFLCCPIGDLPSPKDFVSDGEWRMCGNYSPPQNTTLLYVNSAKNRTRERNPAFRHSDWQSGLVKWSDVLLGISCVDPSRKTVLKCV